MLAEEETSAPSKPKAAPKAGAKKGASAARNVKPAGPGAIAAGGALSSAPTKDEPKDEPETFSATGLDNALDLLDVVTAKMDKASVGQRAADIEKHPEVRSRASGSLSRTCDRTRFLIEC